MAWALGNELGRVVVPNEGPGAGGITVGVEAMVLEAKDRGVVELRMWVPHQHPARYAPRLALLDRSMSSAFSLPTRHSIALAPLVRTTQLS